SRYFIFKSDNNHEEWLDDSLEGHYLQILNNDIQCLDCPEEGLKLKVNIIDDNSEIKLDENGLRIKNDSNSVEINKDGVQSETESVKVKIGKDGIEITSDKN